MTKQKSCYKLEVKSIEDSEVSGRKKFRGIVSTSDLDNVGDIIGPTALKRSLDHRTGSWPLLLAHDKSIIIGSWIPISYKDGTLEVEGTLYYDDVEGARMAYNSFKDNSVFFSIGYYSSPSRTEKKADGSRLLTEVRLVESSVVVDPANSNSVLTEVKNMPEEVLQQLITDIAEIKATQSKILALLESTPAADNDSTVETTHAKSMSTTGFTESDLASLFS